MLSMTNLVTAIVAVPFCAAVPALCATWVDSPDVKSDCGGLEGRSWCHPHILADDRPQPCDDDAALLLRAADAANLVCSWRHSRDRLGHEARPLLILRQVRGRDRRARAWPGQRNLCQLPASRRWGHRHHGALPGKIPDSAPARCASALARQWAVEGAQTAGV